MAKLKKWSGVATLKKAGQNYRYSPVKEGASSPGGAGRQGSSGRVMDSFGGGFGSDKGGTQKRVTSAPTRPRRRP